MEWGATINHTIYYCGEAPMEGVNPIPAFHQRASSWMISQSLKAGEGTTIQKVDPSNGKWFLMMKAPLISGQDISPIEITQ